MTLANQARPVLVATEQVLTVTGLEKRFGDRVAVDDVSFTVAPGETYGLLGPNGAGKTTTIRLVCGLLRADHGGCVIAGRPVGPSGVGAARDRARRCPRSRSRHAARLGCGCLDHRAVQGWDRRRHRRTAFRARALRGRAAGGCVRSAAPPACCLSGAAQRIGQRTMATGQGAWCRTCWPVEPSSRPVKPPRPREPTTTRSAPSAACRSARAGWPGTSRTSTSVSG
ncbi:ABC transporter family protein [Kribbella sp. VKM Ac-2568]|nr:ABC transporter family protein [Kribbella sp. VKM Ac-2568]